MRIEFRKDLAFVFVGSLPRFGLAFLQEPGLVGERDCIMSADVLKCDFLAYE